MPDVPFELEGPVTEPIVLVNLKQVDLTVMGIKVSVFDQIERTNPLTNQPEKIPVVVKTPTGPISLTQLSDTTILDKRDEKGFEKASAIVEGLFDDTVNPRVYKILGVEIEPAENLILGELTDDVTIKVNGQPIHLIKDKRMLCKGPTNEFGFLVKLNATLIKKPASVEGYYVIKPDPKDNIFCAHLLEVDSSAPLDGIEERTATILRARSRERVGGPATVDFRGGVRMPDGALNTVVHVYRIDPQPGKNWVDHRKETIEGGGKVTFLREIPVSADAAFPKYGLWRLKGPLDVTNSINLIPPRYIRVMRMISATPPDKKEWDEADTDVRLA